MAEKGDAGDERRKRLLCYASRGPGPIYFPNINVNRPRPPAFSLGLKLKSQLIGSGLSPGPAYAIPTGATARGPHCSPKYSIVGRKEIRGDINRDGPGPAYYPDVNVNRRKPPAYSLSSRWKLREKGFSSPGPIYMLPPALGPKVVDKPAAAEVSLKGRGKERKSMTEGAGFYDIGSPDVIKSKAGGVTLKGRYNYKLVKDGPGPIYLPNINANRRRPPAFSLGIRHTECSGTFFTQCDKDDGSAGSCGCEQETCT